MLFSLHTLMFGPALLALYIVMTGIVWTRDISFILKLRYSFVITIVVFLFVISWRLPPIVKEFASWQIAVIGVGFLISFLVSVFFTKRKNHSGSQPIGR